MALVAGKRIQIHHVESPVGVQARNFRADRIAELGWTSKISLRDGISQTYAWVELQVQAARTRV